MLPHLALLQRFLLHSVQPVVFKLQLFHRFEHLRGHALARRLLRVQAIVVCEPFGDFLHVAGIQAVFHAKRLHDGLIAVDLALQILLIFEPLLDRLLYPLAHRLLIRRLAGKRYAARLALRLVRCRLPRYARAAVRAAGDVPAARVHAARVLVLGKPLQIQFFHRISSAGRMVAAPVYPYGG